MALNKNYKKTVLNILKISFSNIIKLLAGVLVGFLLPKVIGVTDYGYYKTFTLYAGYIGIFHLGIVDGILLKYGGKNYAELDKSSFIFYFWFLLALESIVSIIGALAGLFLLDGELKFIFICLAILLLSTNITSFYQYISQATFRFNEFSLRTVIQSACTGMAVVILWLIHHFSNNVISYRIYTEIYCFIQVLLCFWYVITYRDITFGKGKKFNDGIKDVFHLIAIGLPLLVANLCQNLILNIDRQFVNILFDTDTYAVYAFAYNMLSLITTATSAIATVLYPSLKNANSENLKNNYSKLVAIILGVVFACLLVYFPLYWFVNWFLPQYSNSLPIFRIILPGLACSSAITIVMHNYYKVIGKNLNFFIKSLFILALSCGANFFAYFVFKTTTSISIASIIVMLVWYLLIEMYFVKIFKIKWVKNFTYMVCMGTTFYLATWWNLWWASMLIYLMALVIITFTFYHREIVALINKVKMKNNNNLILDNDVNYETNELIIIGNGFDLHFGLKTGKQDFLNLLNNKNINYDNAINYFSNIGINWGDLEESLGDLDLYELEDDFLIAPDYFSDHESDRDRGITQIAMIIDDMKRALNESLREMCKNADDSLDDVLISESDKMLLNENALIISFNYTSTIEKKYELKPLHIHGCFSSNDELIYGYKRYDSSYEKYFLNSLNEDSDYYISKQREMILEFYTSLKKTLKTQQLEKYLQNYKKINVVKVLGSSMSNVDSDYFDLIERIYHPAKWIVYYHNDLDLKNIYDYSFKDRIKLVKW